MTEIGVVGGDITQFSSDALITAINSGGMWFGGIDGAIRRAAGNLFHNQVAQTDLQDGKAVFARGDGGTAFKNVIFVVDDLKQPLSWIVTAGLREAVRQQLETVTLPAIRTGVMAGAYEQTVQAALEQMAVAAKQFVAENQSLTTIQFVIYNDARAEETLRALLAR